MFSCGKTYQNKKYFYHDFVLQNATVSFALRYGINHAVLPIEMNHSSGRIFLGFKARPNTIKMKG